MGLDQFLADIREQIAQGELQFALDQLRNYLTATGGDLYNEALLHMSRYQHLRREERKGLLTAEQARVQRIRLEDAVLEFLNVIPRKIRLDLTPPSPPLVDEQTLVMPDEVRLEKILGINNLKQIAWIEQGLTAARSVCRLLTPRGVGTGFLVGANLLMTNNHVLPDEAIASETVAEFNYQLGTQEQPLASYRYKLDTGRFHTSGALDYTLVGVAGDSNSEGLERWGRVLLNPHADPVPDEHVIIIQHPNGGPKQIVLTANQVVSLWKHRLHYTTDTMPGSSGSPVFNDMWQVIAIHHAGGNLRTNAKGDKRFVNEGILISAIQADAPSGLWPEEGVGE